MLNLFLPSDNQQIIDRINKLTPDSKAEWGKMNVAQMLAHSQTTLEVALKEKTIKGGLMAFLFGKIAKKKLVSKQPFKKHLPTASSFIVKGDKQFEAEKSKLIDLIKRFGSSDPEEIAKTPHPFFGKLTAEEWNTLQSKHLDHHMRQFGV
jgi:hypothetical protein